MPLRGFIAMRPTTVLTVLCLFLPLLNQSVSAASECERRITFLPQTHAPSESYFDVNQVSEEERAEQREKVIRSQLAIAQFIENNPNTPVFSEQAGDADYTLNILEAGQPQQRENSFMTGSGDIPLKRKERLSGNGKYLGLRLF